MDGLTLVLAGVNVVGAALAAGSLFAFSAFVMDGLDRAGHPAGMAAMQGINLAAPSPLFMLVLIGTALTSLASGVLGLVRWGEPGSPWLIAGAALYVVSLAVTITYHVPRNDALAVLDPGDAVLARAVAPLPGRVDPDEPRPCGPRRRRRRGLPPRRPHDLTAVGCRGGASALALLAQEALDLVGDLVAGAQLETARAGQSLG